MSDDQSEDFSLANDLLWGGTAIAQYIGRAEPKDVYYALERGYLPAKRVGGIWVASRRALRGALLAA